ncbi:MAG: UDP-N-acetylmuramoyl-tripeptide--D-alanyl-D-alanine ligase [Elusimicrobiota bacterium]|jgi:UDP-N-acetylmuramoyl-tripeptide--D-alanyl-D-alanine ligase|nr:UDP-N-acetylmuramoyl-tripeptide--D-alanyl-D-alanine ligase [Elusimicrobiota bacterium]
MEKCFIEELAESINGKIINNCRRKIISGVSTDTRTIKSGDVYFALEGKNFDGHNFIKEAYQKGAVAVVCTKDECNFYDDVALIKVENTLKALGSFAKFYRRKFDNAKVIAITGSNGKTTTKEILASILKTKGKAISNEGNFNNRIGLPLSLFRLTFDTDYAVFEMGTSLFGEISILSGILHPDAAIITNIGFSHLETFGNLEGVFKEKVALCDNIKENGYTILNSDDEFLNKITSNKGKIYTFSLNSKSSVFAKNIIFHSDKTEFDFCYKKDSIKIFMTAKGKFNVLNALAAGTCAIVFGFSLEEIKSGIENFIPPKMRLETYVVRNKGILINDAYNANPSSMRESISAVKQAYPEKKLFLILGDMLELGKESQKFHFELGKFISLQKIAGVFLLGEMTKWTKGAIAKNVFHTINPQEIVDKLKEIKSNENSVYLFKASRGLNLEKVFSKLHKFLNAD